MPDGESAEAAGDGSSWFQTASPLAASIRHNKLYVNINLMKNNKNKLRSRAASWAALLCMIRTPGFVWKGSAGTGRTGCTPGRQRKSSGR